MISTPRACHHDWSVRLWLAGGLIIVFTAMAVGHAHGQVPNSADAVLNRVAAGCMKRQSAIVDSPGQVLEVLDDTIDLRKQGEGRLTKRVKSITKIDRRSDSFLASSEALVNRGVKFFNSCVGINSKYCFELKKPDHSKPWLLTKCAVTDASDLETGKLGFEGSYPRPSRWRETWGEVSISGMIAEVQPRKLRELPGFAVVGLDESPQRVVVTFTHDVVDFPKFSGSGGPVLAAVRSVLTLDATHEYLPVELSQTTTAHGETHIYRANREYTFDAGVVVRTVTKSAWKVTAGAAVVSDIEQVKDERQQLRAVPESEFTLPAFGFPDPAGVVWGRRIPLYLWALAAGLGGVVLFFTLKYVRSRRSA